jgi:hypothetical protein
MPEAGVIRLVCGAGGIRRPASAISRHSIGQNRGILRAAGAWRRAGQGRPPVRSGDAAVGIRVAGLLGAKEFKIWCAERG